MLASLVGPRVVASGERGQRTRGAWLAALALMVVGLSFASPAAMAIEGPAYRVLAREGSFELREYAPYLLAETRIDASFLDAGNVAFGRLFRYISSNNVAREKIAMTAPVNQSPAPGGGYRVGFVVPSVYTRDTVPRPLDPAVAIREVPAQRVASWRYSGRWTESNFRAAEGELRARLRAEGLAPAGDAIIARYDPPFMPTFLRRNEVLIVVKSALRPGGDPGVAVGASVARGNLEAARASSESLPKPVPLVMMGSLTYRARIGLPRDAEAVVELRDVGTSTPDGLGRVVAEQRIPLDGRQVPVPYSFHVERDSLLAAGRHELRGGVVVAGRCAWVSAAVPIDITIDRIDTGPLVMQPCRAPALGLAPAESAPPAPAGR